MGGGTIERTIQGRKMTLERPYTFARWTFIMDPSRKIVYKNTGVTAAEDSKTVIDFLTTNK